jgi:hypothetical protein
VCGLRWGEAVALRRRHIDLLRRRLRIEESLAEVSGHFIFGRTKSHTARAVPLSPGMVTVIERHLESIDTDPDTLLFMGPRARGPLRYRYYYAKQWRPALERLGLPEVGVHVLRHSAAARIVAAGGSPKTLQVVLGHRSASFSLSAYGHLFDADLDALADRLDTRAAKSAAHMLHAETELQESRPGNPSDLRLRRGPPGNRTLNLRIKSPLLCLIELATRRGSVPAAGTRATEPTDSESVAQQMS